MTFNPFLTAQEIASLQVEEAQSVKKQKRTPEQIEAIYSYGNNILISASAGSGKTFVMVERIIDKILRGITIDQLFISTFTVKAAGELKERLEKRIQQELRKTKDANLKSFLSQQLIGIQTADIGTMDAFTQKLVLQYGYTLGISPNFRIMTDKSEQDVLKNDIYHDLFSDYMTGKDAATFLALVKNFSGNSKDSRAFREQIYTIYTFTQATDNPKKWLEEIFLKSYQLDFDQQVQDLMAMILAGRELAELIDSAEYYFKSHYETVTKEFKKTTYKYLTNVSELIDKLQTMTLTDDMNQLFDDCKEIANLASAKKLVMSVGSSKDEDLKAFAAAYNKERQGYLDVFIQIAQTAFIVQTLKDYQGDALPLLKLLQSFVLDFSEQYLQAKIQEGTFEFSDISHFAIAILENNPDILKIYQEKYHEVMVDEYQDNSHTQERLLELLSNGNNRFMVGDIKQSIYRFRQADPKIFNQKFKTFKQYPERGQLIVLKENFRSNGEVLDSTNSLFTHLMDETIGEILYDETHQLLAGSEEQKKSFPENKTQVLIYDDSASEEKTEATDDADVFSFGEAKLVAKEILRLHDEEKVAFSDITLLVSSRTRNENILQTFAKYSIPLVTDGGEQNYLKSVEVMVMLDTLRAIDNPLNDYALIALLKSPMFDFDEDELARISLQEKDDKENFYLKLQFAQKKEGAHPDIISHSLHKKLGQFFQTFLAWRQFSKWHSLYDLIWKIYNDKFYYDYVATLPRAEQRQANLYALSLRADNFEKNGFKGLSRFIGMIDKILETENDLADVEVALPKDAVTLMTIHKSKGLEFPYVFILNSDKNFSRKDISAPLILSRENGVGIKYLADMKKDLPDITMPTLRVSMETIPYQLNKNAKHLAGLSEQMRLLYVAMTRAEKKLYVIGKGSQEKLADYYSGKSEHRRLPVSERQSMTTFQDWFLAVHEAFSKEDLHYQVRFVTDQELLDKDEDKEESSPKDQSSPSDNVKNNRQSERITEALDRLDSVEHLNQLYKAAINLPTVQTPSQIKKRYQAVMDTEGIEVMKSVIPSQQTFELPNFSKAKTVDSTALGTAVHELMQRIDLSGPIDRSTLNHAIEAVSADDEVKSRIQLDKLLAFFNQSELGQLLQKHSESVHREAPFAMLKKDFASQEKFVVRGIIDGYIVLPERIILFDYKTDRYTNSQDLVLRYKDQLDLYAQALKRSYGIDTVEKYLVLLGGQELEVVPVEK